METRCQIFKVSGHDPTGEDAVECNAPAEYCPTCDMNICADCHSEMTGTHVPHEKKPAAGVGEWGNTARQRTTG